MKFELFVAWAVGLIIGVLLNYTALSSAWAERELSELKKFRCEEEIQTSITVFQESEKSNRAQVSACFSALTAAQVRYEKTQTK